MLMRYESRKLLTGKIKWLLVFLVIINAAIYYLYLIPATSSDQEKQIYDSIKKSVENARDLEAGIQIIDSELNAIDQKWEESGEDWLSEEDELKRGILSEVKEEYKEAVNFYSFIDEIDFRAEKLLKISIFSEKDSFSQKNIVKTQNDFSNLNEIAVLPQNGTGLIMLQKFALTDMLVLIGICLLSFQLFGKDGRSGMQKLLNVSLNGRARLRLIQIFTVTLNCMVFVLLIYGCNILLTNIIIGFPSVGVDIHGISEYRNIAFPCTTRKYLFLYMLWKAAAACSVSVLFQAVIYHLNGSKLSWGVLGGIVGISFILWFYIPENPVTKIFRYLNVFGIFDTAEFLGNYQNLNLFSYPIGLLTAGVIGISIVSLLGTVLILLFMPSHIKAFGQQRKKRISQKGRQNIFLYECYKNFWIQKSGLVFLLLCVYLLYQGSIVLTQEDILSQTDYYYEQYSKDFIGKNGEDLSNALKKLNADEELFVDQGQFETARNIRNQAEYLLERGDSDSFFVNERVWNQIFFNKDTELINLLIFLIAIVFSLGGLFQYEAKSKMNVLIYSTENSHKVFWSKFGVSCFAGSLYMTIIWIVTYILNFVKHKEIEGMDWSAWSIEGFRNFPIDVSLRSMLGIVLIQRIISGIVISIILFFLAQVFVNIVHYIVASGIFLILPTVILIVANMEHINPLISLLHYNVEPLLQYIYIWSSWATVFEDIPIYVYIGALLAIAGMLWHSKRAWRN